MIPCAAGLILAVVLGALPGAGADLTDGAASLQLETFDVVWQRLAETFPDPEMGGHDWGAVRDQYRPRAQEAQTAEQLRPVLLEMMALLGSSHLEIIPGELDGLLDAAAEAAEYTPDDAEGGDPGAAGTEPDAVEPGTDQDAGEGAHEEEPSTGSGRDGDLGMQVRLVDGQVLVTRVDEGSAARAAGILPGWVLTHVGRVDTAALTQRITGHVDDPREVGVYVTTRLQRMFQGSTARPVQLTFTDGEGAERVLPVHRRELAQEPVTIGHLPPLTVSMNRAIVADGTVGTIWFNTFFNPVPAYFTESMLSFIEAGVSGVVIDLRGNYGGLVAMVRGLSGHLVDQKLSLGRMRFRAFALELNVNPRISAHRFEGPVAVLVDGVSISTAEVFAGGLQGIGRARVFGTPSAGMALPSMIDRLPNGDALQYPMAHQYDPRGAPIEGEGVVPDEQVPLTRDALLQGRDPAMDAALSWIQQQTGPQTGEGVH